MASLKTKKATANKVAVLETISRKNIAVVYDQEEEKWYESTPEKHEYSARLMQQYQQSWLKQCFILAELLGPKKLYRDLGFGVKRDFFAAFDINPRKAQQMKQIGLLALGVTSEEKMLLPEKAHARAHLQENGTRVPFLSGNGNFEGGTIDALEDIGFTKLRTLAEKLDSDAFARFIEENRLETPSGTDLTVQEVIDMTTRDLVAQFEKQSAIDRKKIKTLTHHNSIMKEHADAATKKVDDAEKKMAHALELEMIYGKAASTESEKAELIALCIKLSADLKGALVRLCIDDRDTETIKEAVMALVNGMDLFWSDGGYKDKIKAAIRGDYAWPE